MSNSSTNKHEVKHIRTFVLEKPNGESQSMVRITSVDGKVYNRQYYFKNKVHCFIHNNGWYGFKIDGNRYAYDVRYLKPYKKSGDTAYRMVVVQNEPTDGTDLPEEDMKEVYTPEELGIEVEVVEVQEQPEVDYTLPVKHEKCSQICMCVEHSIPIYLVGPAGSGKNHVLEQIAAELDMNFYFSNSIQQEYKLTGFIDAGGKYHDTEFYRAATDEKECIFFLDEMDASIPEVLVLLNAAIANGYFEFPTGRVDINHIRFVAAGNTVGSGSDDRYTGRMVIDQATLDRFAIIHFDYDKGIEMYLTKGNKDLVEFVRALRDEAERGSIRATFSYRCLTMVAKLEAAGMELSEVVTIVIVKGLDKDTIRTLRPEGNSKYHEALRKVQTVA